MAKQIIKWKSKDGKEWDTEEEADSHDETYDFAELLRTALPGLLRDKEDAMELAEWLLVNFSIRRRKR